MSSIFGLSHFLEQQSQLRPDLQKYEDSHACSVPRVGTGWSSINQGFKYKYVRTNDHAPRTFDREFDDKTGCNSATKFDGCTRKSGDQENIPPQAHANAVQSDRALLIIIEELSKKVETSGSKIADQTPNHQKSDLDINPKTGKPYKRYCYTYGCCNHWGRNHPGQKAPGHKDEATFKDRMGGSNKNCLGPKS